MDVVSATALPPDGVVSLVDLGGGAHLPVHYRAGSTPTLLILFHGAVDQKLRAKPHFQPLFNHTFGAHQLAISDPGLARSDELKLTWYLGHDGLDLPALLPGYFRAMASAGRFKRVIYFGASGGGHAALHYSFHHPDSLALAVNPQIDLSRYQDEQAITDYRLHCWAGLGSNDELRRHVPMDLPSVYAGGLRNFVCLLNSSGDRHHLLDHTLPFLARIPAASQNRVLLHADFYGVLGHATSVPYKSCVPWIKASVYSPNLYADSLLAKRHQFGAASAPARPAAAAAGTAGPSADDLRIAAAIRAHVLGDPR